MDSATELQFGTTNDTLVVGLPEEQISHLEAFVRGLPCERTRESYRRTLRAFRSFSNELDDSKVTRRHLEAYRALLERSGRSPSTIRRVLATLSSYFSFLVADGIIDRNPMAAVRRPRDLEASPRRALEVREVHQLLDSLDLDTLIGHRDRALLLLLVVQALRISEALALTVEDLDEELGHRVMTVTGKGGKVVRVPLAAETHVALVTWMEKAEITEGHVLLGVRKGGHVQHGQPWTRGSAHRRVRYLADSAGLDRAVFPHLFRHTAATTALQAGVPLHQVQDLLRHSSPSVTRRYDSHRLSLSNPAPHLLASRLSPKGSS